MRPVAGRRGVVPLTDREAIEDRAVRPLRDCLRTISHIVCHADEGLITPEEALSSVFAETIRGLGVPRR